MDNLALYSFVI